MRQAIKGDEQAARRYCGSYRLVRPLDSQELYRAKIVPDGYVEVPTRYDLSVYDDEGFLLPWYWSLPRVR
jgi:hypothetical protein